MKTDRLPWSEVSAMGWGGEVTRPRHRGDSEVLVARAGKDACPER